MKAHRPPFLRKALLTLAVMTAGFAAQAQTVVGWNFGTTTFSGTSSSGTPANATVGSFSVANSFGTVSTPFSSTSASGTYTGASGSGNMGNAVAVTGNSTYNSGTSPYYAVTFTPGAGYSLQFTKFDFGTRSTGTGPQAYALYSSVDNYASPVFTGTIANSSTWAFKTSPAFTLNGTTGTAVTLRLYVYGGTGSPASGTINNRVDDVAITVNAISGPQATEVRAETLADGSGAIIPAQSLAVGSPVTAYSITRDSSHTLIANAAATWSLTSVTGGIVAGDLVPAGDGKSAVFTPHAAGAAVIHAVVSGLTSVDSGVITATASPTNPTAVATTSGSTTVTAGQSVPLTVTVTPGANPTSTGLTVTGDLTAIGGSATQSFTAGANNTFTYTATIPSNATAGTKNLTFSISDAQSRTGTAQLALNVAGTLTIFHTNDTHARVTPHKWVIPGHSYDTTQTFDDVGGIAYMGSKLIEKVTAQPDALVLDGGDISEGNPVGDWNGPGFPSGTYGDGTIVDYYKMLHAKLKNIPGRGGRGLDAQVVGNHDIRDITYFNNLKAAAYNATTNPTGYHLLSMNICKKGTHDPYYEAYTTLTVNGIKIGIIGYTTESADSPETEVNSLIDVVKCDWSSTQTGSVSTNIHFSDIVNELRNNQGCNLVFLLTHMGHSGLCSITGANPTPILVDSSAATLPEVVVSGHWHTYCETVWQPVSLNYKTIFTEAGSFQHYVGELKVNSLGKYISSAYYPLKVSTITPDSDIAAYLAQRKIDYVSAPSSITPAPPAPEAIVGYTTDNLLLDNYMKWWSADEYPWSGNNTAGNWICDAVKWKAAQLFTSGCDLSLEAGGGVRSDIVAGPVKYTNIYETFPWADDTIYMVNMTGQQIYSYFKKHNCDAAMSAGWHVTAFDGVPTLITFNGTPINLTQTYKVAINNYMYLHDSIGFSTIDPAPQTSTYLARTALVDFMQQTHATQQTAYSAGEPRYTLNTEFSGGYRAVVTMMNDADTRTTFDDGFIRLLSANAETMAHRGTPQVPTSLVNADGSVNAANRLSENQWYRSYLGFKTGALKPGDIVEVYGKGGFFGGNPEFIDQEGVQSDGVEFKIVGHDDSLAKPLEVGSISEALDNDHKNHYVKMVVKQTGTNTVVDQNGTALTVMDVTAYAKKTLPGATNDILVLTGVPTSESYAMRFRCDSAVLGSTVGVTALPATSTLNSFVNPTIGLTSAPSVTLTATATSQPGNVYSLTPVADATVASGNPTANTNTTTLFLASATTTASSFGNERAWLKYDLTSIPAGSTITSAQLQLYCWSAATSAMTVAVSGSTNDTWTETGITWNTQPTFGVTLDTEVFDAGATNLLYSFDVTSFATQEFAGDKTASFVAKPVTENTATALTFKVDSREFGSNAPVLQITTAAAGGVATVAQVQFYYRYSANNTTWGAWTAYGAADTVAPYTSNFTFPNGVGYYEFYTRATDSNSLVEPAPSFAQAAIHYTNPSLAVEQPVGTVLASGTSTIDCGSASVGVAAAPAKSFALNNLGAVALTGFHATIDGTNAADFTVSAQPSSSIASNGSGSLVVTFTPSSAGSRSAVLHISSDNGNPTSFLVNLTGTGTGGTNLDNWLSTYFGGTANQSAGAIPLNDGITNLMKFATGMSATVPGRQPGTISTDGSMLTFAFNRSKEAVADGIVFTVEWSDDLVTWSSAGVTLGAPTDNGSTESIIATMPAGALGHRFAHLKVTKP
jgi:2',3'-cyclic-nucleotide 2'-phosphodiesterase / 3'-nucleotidase / 5'-nucleotidase